MSFEAVAAILLLAEEDRKRREEAGVDEMPVLSPNELLFAIIAGIFLSLGIIGLVWYLSAT